MIQEGQIVLFSFPETSHPSGKVRPLWFCGAFPVRMTTGCSA